SSASSSPTEPPPPSSDFSIPGVDNQQPNTGAGTDTSGSSVGNSSDISTPDSAPPLSDSPAPTDTSSADNTTADASNSQSPLSSLSLGADGAPTIPDPTIFTADSFSPKVNRQSGAFTQRIQLDIPPGRNGVQPDLALVYNSQNTANDSIVGYGWSLS